MNTIGWFSRLSNQQLSLAMIQRCAGSIGVAILLMAAGVAVAQNPTPANPLPAPDARMTVPSGYTIHESVDLGGRITNTTGSQAMYSNLVNLQSGPRVQNETFQMHALPGQKNTLVDSLSAVGGGFGGDPVSFARMSAEKGKLYEFNALFRRDRRLRPARQSEYPRGTVDSNRSFQRAYRFIRMAADTSIAFHV